MKDVEPQLPDELICFDQQLIDRQPVGCRRILTVIWGYVNSLLEQLAQCRKSEAALQKVVATLQAENQKLKQPRKTASNSSIPPSTEHPHAKSKSARQPTGKAPGGQLGHPKHERKLVPEADCNVVKQPAPEVCRRCGAPLHEQDCLPDPLRHQVWELPEIKPIIIEIQRPRLLCNKCDTTTAAPLHEEYGSSTAGTNLLASTALFLSRYRGSKRLAAEMLSTQFGVPASASWIVKCQTEITRLLSPIREELIAALPLLSHVNVDETPYKQGSLKSWLWAVCSNNFTVFALSPNRKDDHIQALLGSDFAGTVMCDRAKMYLGFDIIQWCWAHLRRDFVELSQCGPPANELGQELVDLTDELFSHWHLFRGGTLTRPELQTAIADLRLRVEDALHRGLTSPHAQTAGRCRSLISRPEALWEFALREGVEPTNNAAERAVRPLVILRRLSHGTQSAAGSRFIETIMTIVETCRQQGRDVLQFLSTALTSARRGQPLPSLIPTA